MVFKAGGSVSPADQSFVWDIICWQSLKKYEQIISFTQIMKGFHRQKIVSKSFKNKEVPGILVLAMSVFYSFMQRLLYLQDLEHLIQNRNLHAKTIPKGELIYC